VNEHKSFDRATPVEPLPRSVETKKTAPEAE